MLVTRKSPKKIRVSFQANDDDPQNKRFSLRIVNKDTRDPIGEVTGELDEIDDIKTMLQFIVPGYEEWILEKCKNLIAEWGLD